MASADPDAQFFADHPDRRYRIREPVGQESEREFLSLGPHRRHRRRIIVSRVTGGIAGMMARSAGVDFMRVPFLLFADETVEDTDEVLTPIWHEMMENAAADYGMRR